MLSRVLRLRGSSPLARGTQLTFCFAGIARGLIPARAGNTGADGPFNRRARAHPRSRGEHGTGTSSLRSKLGSSPLARGTPAYDGFTPRVFGLIPARAGNTYRPTHQSTCRRAHPRSRGEHLRDFTAQLLDSGSSPLARGTLRCSISIRRMTGLIPARAGNTGTLLELLRVRRAHPRSRGEHSPPSSKGIGVLGSSPLARGTQPGGFGSETRGGLIPARAGNTRKKSAPNHGVGAHPRSRGEHV